MDEAGRQYSGAPSAHQPWTGSQQQLMGIVSSATDAIITVDDNQIITLFNAGAERMFHCSAADAIGKPLDRFIPQRYRDTHREHVRRFGETGVTARAMGAQRPLAAMRADGVEFPVEATISQIVVEGKRLYTAIVRDISERLRAEEALRESEGRLRAIVETAVDGIITIDERGNITSFNPAATRIFGYEPDEVMGKNVNMLMPSPYHEEHDTYLTNYALTGIKKIIGIGREVMGKRKDGTLFPMDLAVSETILRDRRIFTGIVRDITQRKNIETELRRAKEAAEAANKAKDDFLAVLSHELRTPLTPVLGVVSHLEALQDLPQELREDLVIIRRNVEMEARLIDDLLDLTRIARNKIILHPEVVDAHAVVRAALSGLQTEFDTKGLDLVVGLRAAEHHVWADPARLQQVLVNLFANALKFTPPGGTVTVRTLNEQPQRIQIVVKDTGVGIDPDVLPRLFVAFEQGERTVTRKFGGLGLGLSIVKSLLDMQKGMIRVVSHGRDQGATFTVNFETVQAVNHPIAREAPSELISQCRILLVEDHSETRHVMARLLKTLGCTVVTASSVKEAIALAEKESFNLLVSDIGLPDGSGIDVMNFLKQRAPIRGIAITGFGQEEDRRRTRDAGFDTHLTKPVDFRTLRDAIHQVAGNN